MKKVLHIITGLNDGGAEGALFRLVLASKSDVEHSVISLTTYSKYGKLLEREGVRVECLELSCLNFFPNMRYLIGFIRSYRPDVVQTWLYHADLIGGLACFFARYKNLYWGLRQAGFDIRSIKQSTRIVMQACSMLSSILPKAHITCASACIPSHQKIGYRGKFVVIPNGYDLEKLKPQRSNREKLLGSGISERHLVFGMVARFDPAKDHLNLLNAFATLLSKTTNENCKLVIIGKGCDSENTTLTAKISELGIQQHVILLGQSDDIPLLMSCLDFHVLSSEYEGFPNVIAEAMSCAVPCISTAVGDASLIIGDAGWLVPAKNHELLAQAMVDAIKVRLDLQSWELLKQRCRQRIQDNFSLEAMAANFKKVWFEQS